MNRKNFIQAFFRVMILSAMAALVGFFGYKRKITRYADCTNNGMCKGCSSLDRCELLRSVKYRKHGKEG